MRVGYLFLQFVRFQRMLWQQAIILTKRVCSVSTNPARVKDKTKVKMKGSSELALILNMSRRKTSCKCISNFQRKHWLKKQLTCSK